MKIAIFSDLHLGYSRFEEDSYTQAENVLKEAANRGDLIIIAGDIFDSRIPRLETIKRALEILKASSKPIIAIHGNHERRTKGFDNPLGVLASAGVIHYVHSSEYFFEKNGEKAAIFGIGSVPEEYAEEAIRKSIEKFKAQEGAVNLLVIHQDIAGIINEKGMQMDFIENLKFDLIVNGHIHKRQSRLGGKIVMPGSTVITQLKKDEMEPKGYYLFDTASKKCEFIEVPTRKFFYEEINFSGASEKDVMDRFNSKIKELRVQWPTSIISIKLTGNLREGLKASDIRLRNEDQLVFISNELNIIDVKGKIEEIKRIRESNISIREFGRAELERKLAGKIRLFKPSELFEKLIEDSDAAAKYLEEIIEEKNS
jgi:DNA repair exonuclease SbcCD nuclease subunit